MNRTSLDAEVRRHFGNPEEGKYPPLEAVTTGLLEAEKTPEPGAAGRIRSFETNSFTSSGLEPATFRLVA
jgi:hypothetical protein